jgi:lipopolysaccharide/colanic/teichoic acid biosynthesis glycosyltransferase
LQSRIAEGYQVVGFIAASRKRVGRTVDAVPIVGSMENVGKVIQELRISDVIFSTGELSYADILSVIGRAGTRMVNYHLLPRSLEVIIGKGSVDSLDDLPLVQITYNIERPSHRLVKRAFDLLASTLLLLSIYPFVYWKAAAGGRSGGSVLLQLPEVWRGQKSFVGPDESAVRRHDEGVQLFLGKPGLTGLVQLHRGPALAPREVEELNLYYARNQSFLLDLEILLKALLQSRTRRRQRRKGEDSGPRPELWSS